MTNQERAEAETKWREEARALGLPGSIARIGTHTVSPERVYCWAHDPSSPSGCCRVGASYKAKDWYSDNPIMRLAMPEETPYP